MNSPSGLKTWLPDYVKKQNFVVEVLTANFKSSNFEQVIVPTLIDLETLEKANFKFKSNYFKVFDKDGSTLALRTEHTQPIAKVVSSRVNEFEFPLKLFYASNVFRLSGFSDDKAREIMQAGVEYFSRAGLDASASEKQDSEIVELLNDSIDKLKISDYQITLTDSKIWQAIKLKFGEEVFETIHQLLMDANITELKALKSAPAELTKALIYSDLEALEKILDIKLEVIKNLVAKHESIVFDALQLPDLNLYTGINFALYIKGEGKLIALGGRYDKLCQEFGTDLPAIGFAIYVPRVINAMVKQDLLDVKEAALAS